MERGSTQHSGRVDDALAHEVEPLVRSGVEPRARDERMHEPPADDEPTPDVRIAGEVRPMTGLLDLDDIEARSQLAASLRPSAFPCDRDALYAVALDEHAAPDVLEALQALPAGRAFVNVQQVWEALGGERERRDVGDAEPSPGEASPLHANAGEGAAGDVVDETPIEIQIEVELELEADLEAEFEAELEAEDEHVPEVAPEAPVASRPAPGPKAAEHVPPPQDPWWAAPLRTGVGVATIPLKVTAGVLRFARDRLQR